jgi:hypothetical protein
MICPSEFELMWFWWLFQKLSSDGSLTGHGPQVILPYTSSPSPSKSKQQQPPTWQAKGGPGRRHDILMELQLNKVTLNIKTILTTPSLLEKPFFFIFVWLWRVVVQTLSPICFKPKLILFLILCIHILIIFLWHLQKGRWMQKESVIRSVVYSNNLAVAGNFVVNGIWVAYVAGTALYERKSYSNWN